MLQEKAVFAKREQFAVSLRRNKKSAILQTKRNQRYAMFTDQKLTTLFIETANLILNTNLSPSNLSFESILAADMT